MMKFRTKILVAFTMVLFASGIASAQFGSIMYISEDSFGSQTYSPGEEVQMNLDLEMSEVDSYTAKVKYNHEYLEFKDIKSEHDVYADPGSGSLIYVGSSPTSKKINNPSSTLEFVVKDDIESEGIKSVEFAVASPNATVNGDKVDSIIGQGTSIDIDTGEKEKEFDVGIEMSGGKEVYRGEDVVVSSYTLNEGDEFDNVRMELVVDQDQNGEFETDEVVSEKNINIDDTQQSFNISYSNVQLSAGDYEYQVRMVKNDKTQKSYTNSDLAVYEQKQNINVGLGSSNIEEGETATIPLTVEGGSVAGYGAVINYDSSKLEFVSADGVDFSDPLVETDGQGNIGITSTQATLVEDPSLVELRFEGVKKGKADLDIIESNTTFSSVTESDIESTYEDGYVQVNENSTESDDDEDDGNTNDSEEDNSSDDKGFLSTDIAVEYKDGNTVKFTAENTESSDKIESYVWDPMDNEAQSITYPNDEDEFTHKYEKPGKYIASVEVTTVSGQTQTDEVQFSLKSQSENSTKDPINPQVVGMDVEKNSDEVVFGEEVVFDVGLVSQLNVSGYKFRLTYDSSYLEYNGINNTESDGSPPNVDVGEIGQKSYIDVSKQSSSATQTSDLVGFKFKVKDPNPNLDLSAKSDVVIENPSLYGVDVKNVKTYEEEFIIYHPEPDDNSTNESLEDTNETKDYINDTKEDVEDNSTNESLEDTNETKDYINDTKEDVENNSTNESLEDTNETKDYINDTREDVENNSTNGSLEDKANGTSEADVDDSNQSQNSENSAENLTEEEKSIVEDIVAILRDSNETSQENTTQDNVESNETSQENTTQENTTQNESGDITQEQEESLFDLFADLLG